MSPQRERQRRRTKGRWIEVRQDVNWLKRKRKQVPRGLLQQVFNERFNRPKAGF